MIPYMATLKAASKKQYLLMTGLSVTYSLSPGMQIYNTKIARWAAMYCKNIRIVFDNLLIGLGFKPLIIGQIIINTVSLE